MRKKVKMEKREGSREKAKLGSADKKGKKRHNLLKENNIHAANK